MTESTPHLYNPFGQEVLQNLAMVICRELYDRFVIGGWEPQDAHECVIRTVKAGMEAKKP